MYSSVTSKIELSTLICYNFITIEDMLIKSHKYLARFLDYKLWTCPQINYLQNLSQGDPFRVPITVLFRANIKEKKIIHDVIITLFMYSSANSKIELSILNCYNFANIQLIWMEIIHISCQIFLLYTLKISCI